MHYRVRYSLDFDPKIRSGQVWIEGVKYNFLQKTKTILTEPKTSIFLNMFFDLLRRNKPNSNPNFTPIDPILDS